MGWVEGLGVGKGCVGVSVRRVEVCCGEQEEKKTVLGVEKCHERATENVSVEEVV